MKIVLKVIGGLVIVLIVLLIILRITGLPPNGGRPGLWLTGNAVTTPVTDWSFTANYPTVEVQTNTWYGIPHSVTIYCVTYNGKLYLSSLVVPGAPAYPQGRAWNQNIARDPHVRVEIGDQLYDLTATYVTDPAEHDGVMASEMKKYPDFKYPAGSTFNVFRMSDQ